MTVRGQVPLGQLLRGRVSPGHGLRHRWALIPVVAVVVASMLGVPLAPTASAGPATPAEDIARLAGADRAETAAAIATNGWASAETVVLADLDRVAAALVGGHLGARLDAPLLGVRPDGVPPATLAVLDVLAPTRLVVLGEEDLAVPDGSWSVQRVTGDTPADLAGAAAELQAEGPVIVAAVDDALAAGNLAPATLLLTVADALPDVTRARISSLDPSEVIVLGGPAAVNPAVVAEIEALGPVVRRIAGATRFETAIATAGRRPRVAVASGATAADAVAIIGWAVRRGADILLTAHDELPATVDAHLRDGAARAPGEVVVVGGDRAVGTFAARQAAAAAAHGPAPGFRSIIRPLDDAERAEMTGVSWREGCPVGLDALAVLDVDHWTMDGNVRTGQLIVAADVAADVRTVLATMFDARFPVERMEPVRRYAADDDASMAANNTSAFSCRTVAGTDRWSEHAYGTAIDLNPVQNPYVRGSSVTPPAGRAFLDRTDVRPGMIVRPGVVTDAFAAIGWGWGADFSTGDDYHHFSQTGR